MLLQSLFGCPWVQNINAFPISLVVYIAQLSVNIFFHWLRVKPKNRILFVLSCEVRVKAKNEKRKKKLRETQQRLKHISIHQLNNVIRRPTSCQKS